MGRLMLRIAVVLWALGPAAVAAHGSSMYRVEVQAGPYPVIVEFSEWPLRAERSVDILVEPAGGILDKSGTISFLPPAGQSAVEVEPGAAADEPVAWELVRHPRFRDVWGVDLIALPWAGEWTIELTVNGPLGTGTGVVGPVVLLERPGPPASLAWAIGMLPIGFLVWLVSRGWWRVRPARQVEARVWSA
jgi:hypothetical protein